MQTKTILLYGALALGLIFLASALLTNSSWPIRLPGDDWVYKGPDSDYEGRSWNTVGAPAHLYSFQSPMMIEDSAIGFSVGGAKDIGNFRENIANDFLPILTDITYEGLIYDYYFDTGQTEACASLFCPSYSMAVSPDPLSGETEYYLSVGLNSGLKESDFSRKKLNLVIVLDISGSMSSPFNRYYYDQFGNRVEAPAEERNKSKLRLATEAVVDLLDHLNTDDRLGIVLFDNDSYIGKPLSLVGETNMAAIRGHVLELQPAGGTNFEAGYTLGTSLFEELGEVDPQEFENRIIFLTDAMPNIGVTNEDSLLGLTNKNANDAIHTTFIGIGVDFNTALIESITKIRGANYYSVHSGTQFKERMDEGFEYMVTPLVFDLSLTLESQGFEILKVYGSPEADQATNELMKVNTLFPSKVEGGETKGGLVLLKLRRLGEGDPTLTLSVSYEDRNGVPDASQSEVVFEEHAQEFFQNEGIRKGVLLARYTDFMQNWIIDERRMLRQNEPIELSIDANKGIIVPDTAIQLGQWERQSTPLHVMAEYKPLLASFKTYFETEMHACNDETLDQEMEILTDLISFTEE